MTNQRPRGRETLMFRIWLGGAALGAFVGMALACLAPPGTNPMFVFLQWVVVGLASALPIGGAIVQAEARRLLGLAAIVGVAIALVMMAIELSWQAILTGVVAFWLTTAIGLLFTIRPSPIPDRCMKCGYSLAELEGSQCPECGAAFRRVRRTKCPGCRYPLEGLTSGVCPECGKGVEDHVRLSDP